MAKKRLSMRKIHEVLRLAHDQGLGIRAISKSIKASPSTVGDYLRRAKVAGLTWPLPADMDEATLEGLLFKPPAPKNKQRRYPDFAYIHEERKRKGVTLALLWQEYKAEYPDGLQYSQFSEKYRVWRGKLDVVMRQEHRAGEKLFVDYAGQTVPVVDRDTGEIRETQMALPLLEWVKRKKRGSLVGQLGIAHGDLLSRSGVGVKEESRACEGSSLRPTERRLSLHHERCQTH